MTNNTSGINTEIKVNGQMFETVTSFKYLVSVITDEGFKPKILSRTAQTTANDRSIYPSFEDKADARIFEKVLFFEATYNIKINNLLILPVGC